MHGLITALLANYNLLVCELISCQFWPSKTLTAVRLTLYFASVLLQIVTSKCSPVPVAIDRNSKSHHRICSQASTQKWIQDWTQSGIQIRIEVMNIFVILSSLLQHFCRTHLLIPTQEWAYKVEGHNFTRLPRCLRLFPHIFTELRYYVYLRSLCDLEGLNHSRKYKHRQLVFHKSSFHLNWQPYTYLGVVYF